MALLRPIAMMVPNYAKIAEIILISEGFDNAQRLANKMWTLYRLASEQLSKQDHYDFGLRAIKSVLLMAGKTKRRNPGLPEEIVLIRAMKDANIPKFVAADVPLFLAIITDLFPTVKTPPSFQGDLEGILFCESRKRVGD